jgi:Uma2 family endonuclease
MVEMSGSSTGGAARSGAGSDPGEGQMSAQSSAQPSIAVDHEGPWAPEDLDALPESGIRYELVEGTLIVNPQPIFAHQRIAFRLAQRLDAAVPPECVVAPELEVLVPAGMFIPDVCVFERSLVDVTQHRFPAAALRLVVEVESPTSRRRDRILKSALYAEAGIEHYWRVECPEPGQPPTLVACRLNGDVYAEAARLEPGTIGRVSEPFPLDLDPADLLR